jgi:hypothetical protein
MADLFSDIQTEFRRMIEYYVQKQKKSLIPPHSPNTYLTEPSSQATYLLEPKNLFTYLDVAEEIKHPLLNAHTFYLHDLSDYQHTPYNSLIFEVGGNCFKTKATTSQVINHFATYNEKPYELIQAVGQLIGVTQKCPYIVGDLFFAPDRGTSKNEANWLGLHHVLDTKSQGENTHFLFSNNHELTLPLNKKTVSNIIERTFIIHRFEQIFIYNLLKNYDLYQQNSLNYNVVKKMNYSGIFQTEIPSNQDVFLHLSFLKAIEISANIMGVSHLTNEELEDYYPDWTKKK